MTEDEFKELETLVRNKHQENVEELIKYLRQKLLEEEAPAKR